MPNTMTLKQDRGVQHRTGAMEVFLPFLGKSRWIESMQLHMVLDIFNTEAARPGP